MLLPTQTIADGDAAPPEPSGQVDASKRRTDVRTALSNVCVLLSLPVCTATLLSLIPGWWFADLFTNFRVQYLLVLVVAVAVTRRHRRTAIALSALLALNAIAIAPTLIGAGRVPPSDADLTIITANVLSDNDEVETLLDWIDDVEPDVIAILEYTSSWQRSLAPLRARYPHTLEAPQSDNFGIAVFSRRPFDGEIVVFGQMGVLSIVATFDDGPRVIATHPVPPGGSAYARDRDAQFVGLAEATQDDPRTVVVGDFNATPFSGPFRRMLRDGALRRAGGGIAATWPAEFPPLWIALDHALVGPSVEVVDYSVGPHIGSDHLPTVVRIR